MGIFPFMYLHRPLDKQPHYFRYFIRPLQIHKNDQVKFHTLSHCHHTKAKTFKKLDREIEQRLPDCCIINHPELQAAIVLSDLSLMPPKD